MVTTATAYRDFSHASWYTGGDDKTQHHIWRTAIGTGCLMSVVLQLPVALPASRVLPLWS
jgi:hypothetical protein